MERKRILQRSDRPDIPITVKDARDAIEERAKSKEKKRKHRKSHGQISFRDLADLIAERWKDVEDSTKAMLRHEADKERVFFNQQMHEWENLEKGILSISKTIMQTQSTQAQEKTTKGRFVVSPQDEDGSAESSMEDSFLQKQYEQLHFLISSSPLRQSKGKSIFSDKSKDTATVTEKISAKLVSNYSKRVPPHSQFPNAISHSQDDPKRLIDSLFAFVSESRELRNVKETGEAIASDPEGGRINCRPFDAPVSQVFTAPSSCGTGMFLASSMSSSLNELTAFDEDDLAPTPLAPHVETMLSLSRQRNQSGEIPTFCKKQTTDIDDCMAYKRSMKTTAMDLVGFACPPNSKRVRMENAEDLPPILPSVQVSRAMQHFQQEGNDKKTMTSRNSSSTLLGASFHVW